MPNDMAATIMSVLTARVMPMLMWLSSMSLTKLISGTPGTMNRAQAMSGCQGVSLCVKGISADGMCDSITGSEMYADRHASSVEKNAAKVMLTYSLEPVELSHALRRKPAMAAIEE